MSSEGNQAIRKGHKHFRRMNCLEGYIQKVGSYEVPHPQSLFYTIYGLFLKVKFDKTKSKRSADKSKKLVNHQRLRKKTISSLSNLKQVDQKALGSRSESLND